MVATVPMPAQPPAHLGSRQAPQATSATLSRLTTAMATIAQNQIAAVQQPLFECRADDIYFYQVMDDTKAELIRLQGKNNQGFKILLTELTATVDALTAVEAKLATFTQIGATAGNQQMRQIRVADAQAPKAVNFHHLLINNRRYCLQARNTLLELMTDPVLASKVITVLGKPGYIARLTAVQDGDDIAAIYKLTERLQAPKLRQNLAIPFPRLAYRSCAEPADLYPVLAQMRLTAYLPT